MNILISKHASKRLEQRKKIKNTTVEKDVEYAWYKGIGRHNIANKELDLFDKHSDRIVRIYDNFIYLFTIEENTIILITLLYLDRQYRDKVYKKRVKKHSKGYINRSI